MGGKTATARKYALVALIAAAGYLALRPLCVDRRETLVLLMVPVLGAALLLFWPATRRVKVGSVVFYAVAMTAIITAALAFVSRMANGSVIWTEVSLVTYFAFGWRLAWEVWRRTVGRAGERYVRLARRRWSQRRVHPLSGRRRAACLATRWLIPLARLGTTMLAFVPVFLSTVVTLRAKIGNSFDPYSYAQMHFEEAVFTTADGLTLHGWYLPERGADSTVVICHGLGANKGNFFEFVRVFYGKAYNVLIFDFRGHGDSDGHTAGLGLLEDRDVLAAVRWLKTERPNGARHVYGLGSSMGAAALVRAARRTDDIEALILDSCYASAEVLAEQQTRRLPVVGPLFRRVMLLLLSVQLGQGMSHLDPAEAIRHLGGRPVLLIHAAGDVIIPPENLDILYRAASEPKEKWLGPGTHSNVLTEDFAEYQDHVLRFLAGAAAGRVG